MKTKLLEPPVRMEPPYAAIDRLVDFIVGTQADDWRECEDRLGRAGNRNHILNSAVEVQIWLDANLMTVWGQIITLPGVLSDE